MGLCGVVIVAFSDHLPLCAKSCDATDSAIPLLKIPPPRSLAFAFDRAAPYHCDKSPVSKSADQSMPVAFGAVDPAVVLCRPVTIPLAFASGTAPMGMDIAAPSM